MGPFVLLIVGLAALIIAVRRRSQKLVDVPVTDEEHRRVEQLLAEGGKRS
jgi:cytochrome c-type biogenesis protein CcmH